MRASLLVLLLALGCGKKAPDAPPAPGSAPPPAAMVVAADAAPSPSPPPPPPPPPPVDAPPIAIDAATPDAALGKMSEVDRETIGGFALGASSTDVVKALGQPTSKSKEETMGATGETVSTWNFHGLAITMSKVDKGHVVNAIGVKAPSDAATSRGVHIGSTRAEVEASYIHGKGESGADANSFLVGSPFGGELFTFKRGVVTEIFLGAMAE